MAFHVSTLLTHNQVDRPHLAKKQLIGNDVVAIIFQVLVYFSWEWKFCSQRNFWKTCDNLLLTTFIRKKKWRFIPKWLHPIFYMLFLSLDQLRRATKLQWLQGESNHQCHLRPGRMYLTLDLNSLAIRLILQIGASGGWGDYRNKADSILFSFGKRKPPA